MKLIKVMYAGERQCNAMTVGYPVKTDLWELKTNCEFRILENVAERLSKQQSTFEIPKDPEHSINILIADYFKCITSTISFTVIRNFTHKMFPSE